MIYEVFRDVTMCYEYICINKKKVKYNWKPDHNTWQQLSLGALDIDSEIIVNLLQDSLLPAISVQHLLKLNHIFFLISFYGENIISLLSILKQEMINKARH